MKSATKQQYLIGKTYKNKSSASGVSSPLKPLGLKVPAPHIKWVLKEYKYHPY